MEAQFAPRQQVYAGTTVLGMTISGEWTTNTTLLGHISVIRVVGVPIGLETDEPEGSILEAPPNLLTTIAISNDTVSTVLQKIIGLYPLYTWQMDTRASYVDVYPEVGALCVKRVAAYSITNQSLVWIFTNELSIVKGLNISLREPWSRGRPVNQHLFVTLEFEGGTLMKFLNRLALSIGDGVSWSLDIAYGYPSLRFTRPAGFNGLRSYEPPEKQTQTLAEKLQSNKALLAKAATEKERMDLHQQLGFLYSKLGNKEMAKASFDAAILEAPNDEEKCRIKEVSAQFLHAVNVKTEAEQAVESYREIIRSCGYEDVRFGAMLDEAYVLKSYEREAEAVAVLKEAMTQYPRRADLIRETMQAYYPSHLSELPAPIQPSTSAIPPVFFQRLPTTNPPQKEIHFNQGQ